MLDKLYIVLNLVMLILASLLFGVVGFLSYLIGYALLKQYSNGFDTSIDDLPTTTSRGIEHSIEDAWKRTSQTTVPEDMYIEYRDYLKSPEWLTLRKLALKRDSHRCIRCGYIGNLQVHHTSYTGIYENFNFSIDQLESICLDCHRDVHRGILRMKKD